MAITMKMIRKEECDLECIYHDFYMVRLRDYERLILLAAKDIAHLTREIVGLRYLLADKYPHLKLDIYKDLENHIDFTDLYEEIVTKYNYDPLSSERHYNDLNRLSKGDKSWRDIYPFSIKNK